MISAIWNRLLRLLYFVVRTLVSRSALPKPGRMRVVYRRARADMIVSGVTIPAIDLTIEENKDAKGCQLHIDVDGSSFGDPLEVGLNGHPDSDPFEITTPEGEVDLTLKTYDDAKPQPNFSEASSLHFTARDTQAPAKPGDMGVRFLRETPDAAPGTSPPASEPPQV